MMSQSGGGTLVGMDICVFSSRTNDTPKYSIANRNIGQPIRKDCFQVKSNLLTNFRFTTHMNIMILN